MKPSTVLKEARFIFEHSNTYYVCSAIDKTKAPKDVKQKLWDYIDTMLEKRGTLESWLYVHNPTFKAYYDLVLGISDESWEQNDALMKQTRLNWMDHMIKELEAKGQ